MEKRVMNIGTDRGQENLVKGVPVVESAEILPLHIVIVPSLMSGCEAINEYTPAGSYPVPLCSNNIRIDFGTNGMYANLTI
ncbi:MAG: hypothetical protein MZU95_12560 [Desulfomicrobium escambiense]|nr:hypothetical protein [Desulfomicrobium escambiense]